MGSYSTKRDWWLLALLWVGLGAMGYAFADVISDPVALRVKVGVASMFVIIGAIIAWCLYLPYRTFYVLDDMALTIRVGPFTQTIPLVEISEVYPTHNPLSAPAWSLDRVRIRYSSSRFGALISPERQEQFLDELEVVAPHLERSGNRLILRAEQA